MDREFIEVDGVIDFCGVRQRGVIEGENQKIKENFQIKFIKFFLFIQVEVESVMKQV